MVQLFARLWIKDYKNISSPTVKQAYAKLCSALGIVINLVLFLLKLLCGTISGSAAIIAGGFNNLADVATTILSFLGFIMAGIGAGKHHPFGHGRYEWLMSMFSSIAVMIMGFTLAGNSIGSIKAPEEVHFNYLIGFLLCCSILAKSYMFLYNNRIGKQINSSAMKSTAADSISDLLSTTAILIALIIQTVTGWSIDGWCGLFVSVFIIISGFKALAETIERILGEGADQDLIDRITLLAGQYPAVHGVTNLIIHDYGLGHVVISMHLDGLCEEQRPLLDTIAHDIEYALYTEMDCTTTIQVDILDVSEDTANTVKNLVSTVFQRINVDAKLQDFRAVKAQSITDVTLTIAFPRRLQKREKEIRKSLEEAFLSCNPDYRLTVRFVIATVTQKNKFSKQRRNDT